jgi:GTP-binding nuclear protein Ran
MSRITIAVLGAAGVGKTAWIERFQRGEFEKRYVATSGIVMSSTSVCTSQGYEETIFLDTASQERYADPSGGSMYHVADAQGKIVRSCPSFGLGSMGVDAVIVMFDLTSRTSFCEVSVHIKQLRSMYGANMPPIVVCGNKADCLEDMWRVSSKEIHRLVETYKVTYFHISAKSNFNLEKPYLELLREVRCNSDLKLVDAPAIFPPEVILERSEPIQPMHSVSAPPSHIQQTDSTAQDTNTLVKSSDTSAIKSEALVPVEEPDENAAAYESESTHAALSDSETRVLEDAWKDAVKKTVATHEEEHAHSSTYNDLLFADSSPLQASHMPSELTTLDVPRAISRVNHILGHLSGFKVPLSLSACGSS